MACAIPPGVGTSWDVSVLVSDQPGTAVGVFEYDLPLVTAIMSEQGGSGSWVSPIFGGAREGGFVLSVAGVNFGTEDYSPQVSVGGVACASTVWVSDTALECETVSYSPRLGRLDPTECLTRRVSDESYCKCRGCSTAECDERWFHVRVRLSL